MVTTTGGGGAVRGPISTIAKLPGAVATSFVQVSVRPSAHSTANACDPAVTAPMRIGSFPCAAPSSDSEQPSAGKSAIVTMS